MLDPAVSTECGVGGTLFAPDEVKSLQDHRPSSSRLLKIIQAYIPDERLMQSPFHRLQSSFKPGIGKPGYTGFPAQVWPPIVE